jgi:toxin ParE1/3/4
VIRIIFTDEARADTLNAFAFYEERRSGLGERFREHVDLAISKIQNAPLTYPLVYRGILPHDRLLLCGSAFSISRRTGA